MVLRKTVKELEAVKGLCKCVKLGFPITSSNKKITYKTEPKCKGTGTCFTDFLKASPGFGTGKKRKRKKNGGCRVEKGF